MLKVYRRNEINGQVINGIIKNHSYFLVAFEVYEDGMINCWELVDLSGFREKIDRGWVMPSVPQDETIYIHELGTYRVSEAEWFYDKTSYCEFVTSIIREINPEMKNLYHITQREKDYWNKRRVVFSPNATPFLMDGEVGCDRITGKTSSVFYHYHGDNYFTKLAAYKDQTFALHGLPELLKFSFDEIDRLFENGSLFTSFPTAQFVFIEGLGRIKLQDTDHQPVDLNSKLLEIKMLFQTLNDDSGFWGNRIHTTYHNYLRRPGANTKQLLQEAYESIPEYRKRYLDKIEPDIIRILYSDEKREV